MSNTYAQSATHRLTIAAIHTPPGVAIADTQAVHDANCTTCPKAGGAA